MPYDRVKILRNVSTCNNSFKIWSRRTYFIIACVNNGKYVLNESRSTCLCFEYFPSITENCAAAIIRVHIMKLSSDSI